MLHLLAENLLAPAVLFFLLGIASGILKSDLNIPEQIAKFLSIYLVCAIGFKGGHYLQIHEELTIHAIMFLVFCALLSFAIPFVAYFILTKFVKIDKINAAVIAAHYGSISIITFITATDFLNLHNQPYQKYMLVAAAIMEIPAIISGFWLVQGNFTISLTTLKNSFGHGSIILMIGSFIIGRITNQQGYDNISGFLVTPFYGFLCLFMLDIGIVTSNYLHHLKNCSFRLFLFGFGMPILNAFIALIAAKAFSLDVGTSTLLLTLAASASYIAVPSVMRISLPNANYALSLPLVLGVTFPFNISIGIPLYYKLSQLVFLS